jgi:hypothetical protein
MVISRDEFEPRAPHSATSRARDAFHRRSRFGSTVKERGSPVWPSAFCVIAGLVWPDVADHLEVAGHIIQNLGDVLAELGIPLPQSGHLQAPSSAG